MSKRQYGHPLPETLESLIPPSLDLAGLLAMIMPSFTLTTRPVQRMLRVSSAMFLSLSMVLSYTLMLSNDSIEVQMRLTFRMSSCLD